MMKLRLSPQILIVDDDQMAQETLEAILYREGYNLHFANSGADALARLPDIQPDVILLDVMMPQMSGFEVCQHLKASPDWRHIPIILVTALDGHGDLVQGLDAGADEFVAKPVHGPELRARVRSMLRIKRQYDQLQRSVYLRDLLANIVAHDLRNPLAAILLYMQLLKKKSQGTILNEQSRYLDMVLTEAQHMSDFLEDTLTLAKLEQGSGIPVRTPVDVRKVLQDLEIKLTPAIQAKQLEFVISQPSAPVEIGVDQKLFTRALEHLLTYAIKVSAPNGRVTVQVESPRQRSATAEGPQLRLIVSEEGDTLPLEEKLKMFDKYAMVEMKQMGRTHFGLGLAYCKLVVDAHEGKIQLAAKQPTGTNIIMEL